MNLKDSIPKKILNEVERISSETHFLKCLHGRMQSKAFSESKKTSIEDLFSKTCDNCKNGIFQKLRKMQHFLKLLSFLPSELRKLYRLWLMFFGVIILQGDRDHLRPPGPDGAANSNCPKMQFARFGSGILSCILLLAKPTLISSDKCIKLQMVDFSGLKPRWNLSICPV